MAGAAFKQKIIHSKLGATLQGDLKQLAEVINSDKSVLSSTTRLSQDTLKASAALRDWASAEGDDFEDVFSKLSFLFDQLAKAQSKYAEHEATVRLHYKTLRTREENFIALKKSKDSLHGRIESAERQLGKTSAEHKDRAGREARLAELRNEMVGLEHAVLNEEARLSDFKRDALREALSLKLGAMLELAEKQTIVAEMGKLLIAELPASKTQPGHPRANYAGYTNTEEVMQEAQRCLSSVVFNPNPTNAGSPATPTGRFHRDSSGPIGQQLTDEPSSFEADASIGDRSAGVYDSPTQEPASQFSQTSLSHTSYTSNTDNRSSLAYMDETPDSEPAPVQTKAASKRIPTPVITGPPSTYSAANGAPRHGVRDDPAAQYAYEEDATSWSRNHAQAPAPPAPPSVVPPAQPEALPFPTLPQQPSHFSASTMTTLGSYIPPASPTLPANPQLERPTMSEQPSRSYITAREKPTTPRLSTFSADVPTSPVVSSPVIPSPVAASPTTPAPPYYPLSHEETQAKLSQSLPVAPPRLGDSNLIYTGSSPKLSQSTSTAPARKPAVRADSALGSRFGFDDPAYRAKEDPNNLSQNNYFPGVGGTGAPSVSKDNTAPPSGYTYHRPADPPKITASAFRRNLGAGREAAYPPGDTSPAAQIRDAYMQQQAVSVLQQEQERLALQTAQANQALAQNLDDAGAMAPTPPLKLGGRRDEAEP